MIRDLLTPTHLVLILLVVFVLFGAKRLPDFSRSLGRSMRIFKSEVQEMKEDDKRRKGEPTSSSTTPPTAGTPTNPLEGRVVDAERDEAARHTHHGA